MWKYRGRLDCADRREDLDQEARQQDRGHLGDAVPKPLLVDEACAAVMAVPGLHQQRPAQRAADRHRHRGDEHRRDQRARRVQRRHPAERAHRRDAGQQQIGATAIAEQRHEVRDRAPERLDHPGQVEHRQCGADGHRVPALDLLEVVGHRLAHDADLRLADTLHRIDDGEEPHYPANIVPFREIDRLLHRS
jgi:hypothetical protein